MTRRTVTAKENRTFAWTMAAVALVGLAVRVVYVLHWRQHRQFAGDAHFYHAGANLLAEGRGFISPFGLPGLVLQAAEHPPLYMLYLSIPSSLGMTSTLAHLLWSCLLGTGTVVLVGLLGRQVGGPPVGIVAAVIAAFDPNLWAPDGSLQAETMAMFMTALALLLAYRYWKGPSWGRLAACGAACGGAALSRSELILLVPFMLLPLALLTPDVDVKARLRSLGAGALATLVVVGPWVGYNLERFRQPEFLSSQFGALLSSANCDAVWFGRQMSYFSIDCTRAIVARDIKPGLDQSQADQIFRRAALDYIDHHKGRLPAVVGARLGAIIGVYRPSLQLQIDIFVEGREAQVARAELDVYHALVVLAIVGAIFVRRRRVVPLFPLLALPALVLVTVIVTYASSRFRASAEVVLVVLAAVTVEAGVGALGRRRDPGVRTTPAPGSGVGRSDGDALADAEAGSDQRG